MCHRLVTIAFGSVTLCVRIVTPPVADLCHDVQINWLYAHRVTDDFGPVTTCYEPDVMGQGVFNEGALFRLGTPNRGELSGMQDCCVAAALVLQFTAQIIFTGPRAFP